MHHILHRCQNVFGLVPCIFAVCCSFRFKESLSLLAHASQHLGCISVLDIVDIESCHFSLWDHTSMGAIIYLASSYGCVHLCSWHHAYREFSLAPIRANGAGEYSVYGAGHAPEYRVVGAVFYRNLHASHDANGSETS